MVKLPYQSHFFDRDGLRYHYLDEGSGSPVVMVHGNPTWCFYYRNLVGALKDRYRTIVPDHIGCGFSDKPRDDRYEYTLDNRVDDLEALLEHLAIRENITLVLHDWGGMIGMAFAARHPQRIRRLVVMNTAAFLMPESKRFPWGLWLCRTPLGALLVRGCNAFSLVASFVCCKRHPLSRDLRRAYRSPYDSWRNRIATLRFVEDIPLHPRDRAYATVVSVQDRLPVFREVPLLICWGEKDFVFSTQFLDEWSRRLPHAEVHRYADAGHYVLEDAAEDVLPQIVSFLEKHPISNGLETGREVCKP